ncbi:hypothetical protein ElyMa_005432300 [Elysia marginata]|uniref:Uncharacterized protein n=1 Tax=Elysia marginata TaxID=1093978 RepID=A0AAV4ELB1_9GAST|nr:hypothetical protein ElyMa_005432300 [Elysia marginata]
MGFASRVPSRLHYSCGDARQNGSLVVGTLRQVDHCNRVSVKTFSGNREALWRQFLGKGRLCGDSFWEKGGFVETVSGKREVLWRQFLEKGRLCGDSFWVKGGSVETVCGKRKALWRQFLGKGRFCGDSSSEQAGSVISLSGRAYGAEVALVFSLT